MDLTPETVQHVATLARLDLTPEELARTTGQLGRILELVKQLNVSDTETIELDATEEPVLRPDEVKQVLDRDLLMAHAPHAENGFFRVPRILDSGE